MNRRTRAIRDAMAAAPTRSRSPFAFGAALGNPKSEIRNPKFRRGFTMIELAVVMAIIVVLAALAVPSLVGLTRMSSQEATRSALRSLFASAKARAAVTQRYVGVRFQQDKDGRSYAIMLEPPPLASMDFPNGCPGYDDDCMYVTLLSVGDAEPILLPRGVEVAAGDYLQSLDNPGSSPNPADVSPWVTDKTKNVPATTFTVVFSSSGQIVRRQVHVSQRRDTWYAPPPPGSPPTTRTWCDPVFNLVPGAGMFLPDVEDVRPYVDSNAKDDLTKDTDPDPQIEPNPPTQGRNTTPPAQCDTAVPYQSQGSIWLYERQKRVDAGATPYSGYIKLSGTLVSLNVYTGAPVNTRENAP